MHDDNYIDIPVTKEMLEDPDEPGIHPLEAVVRKLEAHFFHEGMPCSRRELKPGVEPRYYVTFPPNRNAASPASIVAVADCQGCGTRLDNRGRCPACWGDIFGVCDTCSAILEDDNTCLTCTPSNQSTNQ